MATRNVTTVFAVQGESEYRKAVQNINREIKECNSTLKLLSEQYRGQEDSTEALTEKLKALNGLYETQEQKIGKIEDALKNAQDASAKYVQKGDELQKQLQKNAEDLVKLAESGDKASEAYLKLQEEEKRLKEELDNNTAKFEAAERGVSDWKIKLNDAKTELLKTKSAIDDVSNALNGELTPEFEETKEETKKAGEAFKELADKAASNMDAVASAVAAAGLDQAFDKVWDAMQACIDKSMEFESAMTGVFKTVDMTLEEEAQLSQDIRKMAEEIPVTTTEIAGVAELAGQLGISNDALLDFTETMVKLGTATNLTSEEAAEALAKIANITGTSEENYGRLGSTVVALGNNFATTEADIVNMATRLAATGEVVGLTEAQVFAVATALSSVGIEAEAGGSAISKLLKEIETSVVTYDTAAAAIERTGYSLRDLELMQSNASKDFKALADELGLTTSELGGYIDTVKDLDKYAEISGQTAQEFKAAWGQDAVVALDRFITGLGNVDKTGGNAVETLEEMGLTEIRLSNAVLAMSASGGVLTDALNVANDAWRDNTALTDEAAKRFETTESKVQILKNSVDNLLIAIGDDYKNAMEPAVEWTTDLAQALADSADASPALASTLAGIGGSLGTLTGLTAAASGIKLLVSALAGLGPVGAGITIATAAIGGLAAAAVTYSTNANQIAEETRAWLDQNERLVQSYNDSKSAMDETSDSIEQNRDNVNRLIERVSDLSDKTNKTAADEAILRDAVNELNGVLPNLGLSYDELTEKVNLSRQEMLEFADAAENASKASAYSSYISELTDQQEQLLLQHELTGEKIVEARKKYEEAQKAVEDYIQEIGGEEMWALGFGNPLKIKELEDNLASATSELDRLKDSHISIQDALKDVNSELDIARGKYESYAAEVASSKYELASVSDTIGRLKGKLADYKAASDLSMEAMKAGFSKKLEDLAAENSAYYDEVREQQQESLSDFREAQSERLSAYRETLSEELDAFRDAQDERKDALEEKQQEELDVLKAAHEEKLRLIDEEYTESMKNIDEERYAKLKKIDDQIAEIEGEIEATRQAEKEKNREKRLAAAERKVAEAEDREEKLAAEEALAELEAQIEAEKLEESRKNRITDLKEEKESIKEEFDAKEASIKLEHETEKAAQEAAYAEEETAMKAAHESQRLILEEELEKELKAFQKAQDNKVKAYQKQLDDELKAYQKGQENFLKSLEATFVLEETELKRRQEKRLRLAQETADGMVEAYTNVIKSFEEKGKEAGINFASGYVKGIDEMGPHARTAAKNLGQLTVVQLQKELDEHSPSRKAQKIGRFFGEGLALGLADSETDVANAVKQLSTELDIAPEVANKVRTAQSELGKLRGGMGTAVDPAAEYRNSMAAAERIAAQARGAGLSSGVPIEITVINEVDGEMVSKTVSRRQYRDTQMTMRAGGIKK